MLMYTYVYVLWSPWAKKTWYDEKPQWGSPAAQGVKCNTAGVLLFFAGAILVGIWAPSTYPLIHLTGHLLTYADIKVNHGMKRGRSLTS